MHKQLELIKHFRNELIKLLDGASNEQINKVPEGFNNNLVWHLGHVVVSLQGIAYKRSNNTIQIDEALFEKYKGGTKPEGQVSADDYAKLKEISATTMDQFEKDLASGKFDGYPVVTLGNGLELASVKDAMELLVMHEGMHFGYAQALKRAVAA